jgi:2'-5' RNA ligase
MTRLRLFIAVDLPTPIHQEILGLGQSIPGSRPVPEEQLHLTLKFIGEVDGAMALDIGEALATIEHPAMQMALRGVGCFPPRGEPRVLWVGLASKESVITLRNKVEKKLADIGIAREKKKFAPHFTIARLKAAPIQRVQQFLAGNNLLQSSTFTIDSFHLYKSQLTTKGAIHTQLQSYPLHR